MGMDSFSCKNCGATVAAHLICCNRCHGDQATGAGGIVRFSIYP